MIANVLLTCNSPLFSSNEGPLLTIERIDMTTVKKATKKVAKKVLPLKLVVGGVYKTYDGLRAEVVAKLKGGGGGETHPPVLGRTAPRTVGCRRLH